MHAHISLEKIY